MKVIVLPVVFLGLVLGLSSAYAHDCGPCSTSNEAEMCINGDQCQCSGGSCEWIYAP